jgi:hypothetical protein
MERAPETGFAGRPQADFVGYLRRSPVLRMDKGDDWSQPQLIERMAENCANRSAGQAK